jgi:hypothetical protein
MRKTPTRDPSEAFRVEESVKVLTQTGDYLVQLSSVAAQEIRNLGALARICEG